MSEIVRSVSNNCLFSWGGLVPLNDKALSIALLSSVIAEQPNASDIFMSSDRLFILEPQKVICDSFDTSNKINLPTAQKRHEWGLLIKWLPIIFDDYFVNKIHFTLILGSL